MILSKKNFLIEFKKNQVANRLLKGIRWNIIAEVLNRGSIFASNIIIAQLIGLKSFGKIAIIQSTILAITGVAQLSMGITATKYVAELRTKNCNRINNILGLCSQVTAVTGFLFAAGVFLAAPWIAVDVLDAADLTSLLRIASVAILFSAINAFQIGTLAGLEAFDVIAKLGFIQGCITIGAISVLTWVFSITGAALALSINSIISCILYRWFMTAELNKQSLKVEYNRAWNEKGVFFFFALPTSLSAFIGFPTIWGVRALLVNQPSGYDELGIFAAVFGLCSLLLVAPTIARKVVTPVLNNLYGANEENSFKKLLFGNTTLMTIMAFISGIFMILFARPLLKFYGLEFVRGSTLVWVLALAFTFQVFHESLFQAIVAVGNMWWHLILVALHSFFLFVFSYVWIPKYYAKGLAASYLVAYSVTCFVTILIFVHQRRICFSEIVDAEQSSTIH